MRDKRVLKAQPRSYMQRQVGTRDLLQRFLIVCEGEKTEPNYFKNFRVPKDVIEVDIYGLGDNTLRLVEKAKELKDDKVYDQVWKHKNPLA